MDTGFGTTRHIVILIGLLAIALAGFAHTASVSTTASLIAEYEAIVEAQR